MCHNSVGVQVLWKDYQQYHYHVISSLYFYSLFITQAHSEYNRVIEEADMLESHITQAKAQAAATDSAAFSWYEDSDLLKMNNLISPQDYLPLQKPQVRVSAPAAGTFTF